MERHLDHDLDELKTLLLQMGGWAEQMIQKAVSSLLAADVKLADELGPDDRKMDQLELDVQKRCLTLLALQQPIATDLRLITSALHIATDLERVGDHALNLADSARETAGLARRITPPTEVRALADAASGMLRRALDAFVARDSQGALAVCAEDDAADELEDTIFQSMRERMMQEPAAVPACVQWILAARNLERVADLATNVAEEVIFIAQARVIKHHHEEPA